MILSIVIPNYNGSRTLFDTVKCVLHQIPADSEVLMVDDSSTDQSVELIKTNYPTVKIIKNGSNLGAASARNIGIKQSTGKFILFVDADVLLDPGCVAALLDAARTSDITFPRICYPNGEIMYPVDQVQASYLMISPVFLIRRDSLNLMVFPNFDESYGTYCEDTDFFLRAYLTGLTSCYRPNGKAIHNVDLQPRNREDRYFLEIRNSIYGAIKFLGTNGINHFDHAFKLRNISRLLICGLFNFNLFDMQARGYRKYGDLKYNMALLIKRHDRLTDQGSLALLTLIAKALYWNLKNLSKSLTAHVRMTSQFVKTARKPEC